MASSKQWWCGLNQRFPNTPGSINAATYEGTLYGYPMTSDNGYFLYYDKSIFAEEDLATLNGDMLDCAMNYDFRRYCRRFFAEEAVDAEVFDTNVSTLLLRYRENALYAQLNLLDSHDVSRYLTLCGGSADKMELSVLLQMTFPGMPCVFYGDEKGLWGLSEKEYRQAMAWGKKHPLEQIFRSLIALRKEHPAPRCGDFRTNYASGNAYSYSRVWKDKKISVTMNLGDSPIDAPRQGKLLLKKGENRDIIGTWEYEVREEQMHGGDNL